MSQYHVRFIIFEINLCGWGGFADITGESEDERPDNSGQNDRNSDHQNNSDDRRDGPIFRE